MLDWLNCSFCSRCLLRNPMPVVLFSSSLKTAGASADACWDIHRRCRFRFSKLSVPVPVPVRNSTAAAGDNTREKLHRRCQCHFRHFSKPPVAMPVPIRNYTAGTGATFVTFQNRRCRCRCLLRLLPTVSLPLSSLFKTRCRSMPV